MSHDSLPRRVVITGYGAITPLGNSAAASWSAIMAYQLGYRYYDWREQGIKAHFFGLIDNEPDIKTLPAAIRRRLPRFARLAVAAAQEAIGMAFGGGQPGDYYDLLECGTIVGTGWAGQDESYANNQQYMRLNLGSPFGSIMSMPNVATAACSQYWGLRGYQSTPVAACATGTMAIGDACEAIRSGRASMMLAGGGGVPAQFRFGMGYRCAGCTDQRRRGYNPGVLSLQPRS